MDLFTTIKTVLFEPTKFFTQLKKEQGIKDAIVYLLIVGLFSTILATAMNYIMSKAMTQFLGTNLPLGWMQELNIGFQFILSFVALIAFSFIITGILHLWIMLFGGRASYADTYKVYVYAGTPEYLFSWIPMVNWFTWIYKLVLLVIGTEINHNVSKGRAILIYVLPIIIFVVLGIVLLLVALVFLGSALFSGGLPF